LGKLKGTDREKREQKMKQLAHYLEAQFLGDHSYGDLQLLMDFSLYKKGKRHQIMNQIKKFDNDTYFSIFDFQYKKKGKSARTVLQTAFFINSKVLGLPHFLMKPESIFNRIGHRLGAQDIDFEEHPKFSKKYQLKGDDEEYIRRAYNDKVLRLFTAENGWTLEGINYYLLLYKKGKLMSIEEIGKLIEMGVYLLRAFKEDDVI